MARRALAASRENDHVSPEKAPAGGRRATGKPTPAAPSSGWQRLAFRAAPPVRAQTRNGSPPAAGGVAAPPAAAARPASESVWGLPVTRAMCGCRDRVREDIAWANEAGATYAKCDIPANATNTAVDACFDAAHPTAVVAATTSPSGTMTLPPASSDPCQTIDNKASFVHETMHSRHTDAIARTQGTAFFAEWRRLAGDPDRLDKLRVPFPAEVAAFESQWNSGHDWAQDEVNSYRWERRFLVDALAALNRIC